MKDQTEKRRDYETQLNQLRQELVEIRANPSERASITNSQALNSMATLTNGNLPGTPGTPLANSEWQTVKRNKQDRAQILDLQAKLQAELAEKQLQE